MCYLVYACVTGNLRQNCERHFSRQASLAARAVLLVVSRVEQTTHHIARLPLSLGGQREGREFGGPKNSFAVIHYRLTSLNWHIRHRYSDVMSEVIEARRFSMVLLVGWSQGVGVAFITGNRSLYRVLHEFRNSTHYFTVHTQMKQSNPSISLDCFS